MITFTPIAGAYSDGPLCYLLNCDGCHILLDCGWDDRLPASQWDALRPYLQLIDCVLISHPDLLHLGGLPYLVGKLGLRVPIYATLPVQKMGEMFLYDHYQNKTDREDFTLFTLDDIDAAFEQFHVLKYHQKKVFTEGRGRGIAINPLPAGHMLGSAVWRIGKHSEEVVYAVDCHHRRERLLPGLDMDAFLDAGVVIMDANNAGRQVVAGTLDQALLESVLLTLRGDGNVLMPCDTAGRCFELLSLLDHEWNARMLIYTVCLLSNQGARTIEFAKSMLEWMNDSVTQDMDHITAPKQGHPLEFRHLEYATSLEELHRLPKPIVVLATPLSLNTGLSLDLFSEWAGDPKSKIIFTDEGVENTVARSIVDEVRQKQADRMAGVDSGPPTVPISISRRVPLEGLELAEWQEAEQKKEKEEEEKRKLEAAKRRVILIKDELGVTEIEPEEEMEGSKSRVQPGLFLPPTLSYSSPHLMFPHRERPRRKPDPLGPPLADDILHHLQRHRTPDMAEDTMPWATLPGLAYDDEVVRRGAVPTKPTVDDIQVAIYCTVDVYDLSGRSDGSSLRHVLRTSQAAWKKLVLVHGTGENTQALHHWCLDQRICEDILTPGIQETVKLMDDLNVYRIKLKDELITGSASHQMPGGFVVSYIEGEMEPPVVGKESAMDVDEGEEVDKHQQNLAMRDRDLPVVGPIQSLRDKARGHPAVLVGDLTLSQFARALMAEGWKTEFVDGGLMVNHQVVLRMRGPGDITVEGMLCPEYFQVRDLLQQYYIVL